MSIWTHVAAIIRIDNLGINPPDIGTKASWETFSEEKWREVLSLSDDECDAECYKIKSTRPCGSEGSLDASLWVNPNKGRMPNYMVTIWGDLRDYKDFDEIIEYLSSITAGRSIRQGIATITKSGGTTVNLRYSNDTQQWEKL